MFGQKAFALSLGLLTFFLHAGGSSAQSVEDFYKGKTIRLIIGQSPGGGYDAYARLLAMVMEKHLPGQPTIVAQNMDGASSLKATNYVYNIAPKDGTVFGIGQPAVLLMPILGTEDARFDVSKLTYIGSMDKDVGVCISWRGTGFDTLEDMKKREIVMSTSGKGAELTTLYSVLPKVLGVKIKVVSGYSGGASQELALERGEVQGRCGVTYAPLVARRKEWFDNKKINILLQLGLAKNSDLPNVPLLMDLVDNPMDKKALEFMLTPLEMGRPFFGPADIPPDRVAALRTAFERSMQDPELKSLANKQGLGLDWISGEKMQTMMNGLHSMPREVIARVKELTTSNP